MCNSHYTFDAFQTLVLKNRSYRRFYEDEPISLKTLGKLASLARIVPSSANSQAIKLMLIHTRDTNAKVFQTLGWAGMLADWDGPVEGERPSAYIILLNDLALGKNKRMDDGIIAQTILLGAIAEGYGGCMLGNINRTQLSKVLNIDLEKYSIDLVLALGKPKEEVVLEEITLLHGTRYYRDEQDIHHVPKRSLEELIIYESNPSYPFKENI